MVTALVDSSKREDTFGAIFDIYTPGKKLLRVLVLKAQMKLHDNSLNYLGENWMDLKYSQVGESVALFPFLVTVGWGGIACEANIVKIRK